MASVMNAACPETILHVTGLIRKKNSVWLMKKMILLKGMIRAHVRSAVFLISLQEASLFYHPL